MRRKEIWAQGRPTLKGELEKELPTRQAGEEQPE